MSIYYLTKFMELCRTYSLVILNMLLNCRNSTGKKFYTVVILDVCKIIIRSKGIHRSMEYQAVH